MLCGDKKFLRIFFFDCSCDLENTLSIFRSILKFNLDALLQLLFQFASVILIEDFKGIDKWQG